MDILNALKIWYLTKELDNTRIVDVRTSQLRKKLP